MRTEAQSIDLSRFALTPGGGRRLQLEIDFAEIEVGGARYTVIGAPASARVEISRSSSGWAMRLRFEVALSGPCSRCLEEAEVALEVDAREVDEGRAADEELQSPYVEDDLLDLEAWARDALTLAAPAKYLCRPECAGLCPECGESLNDSEADAHRHESSPDPRWERLRDLRVD